MKAEEYTPRKESPLWTLTPLAWLLIAVVAPAAFVWLNGRDRAEAVEPGATVQDADRPGAARPEQALAEHRARVGEWLESYGWVDREGGIARVPIEEGMRAVVRARLPAREEIEEER